MIMLLCWNGKFNDCMKETVYDIIFMCVIRERYKHQSRSIIRCNAGVRNRGNLL
jgi:hypothetical protein